MGEWDDYNPMYDNYPPLWNSLELLGVIFLMIIAIYLWIKLGIWYDDWWMERKRKRMGLYKDEDE